MLSLAALTASTTAHAAFLYTFEFAALQAGSTMPGASAATISFFSDDIAVFGSTLTYDSGSVNGCEPGEITYSAGSEGFGTGSSPTLPPCSDNFGPLVDGFLFNPDTLPLVAGSYFSTNGAGRVYAAAEGSQTFYTNGRLTIAALGAAVPEPATLGLVGVSLAAALWSARRRGTAACSRA